jgi:hypothetical protein
LKAIKGISTVETQTYTLEEVVGSLEELHSWRPWRYYIGFYMNVFYIANLLGDLWVHLNDNVI